MASGKLIFGFICVVSAVRGDVFDKVLGDMTPCEDVCENSYKDHTYEKGLHKSFCKRGCRLFSILDFIHEGEDMNLTKKTCVDACSEAYSKPEDQQACNSGCSYQVPYAAKKHQMLVHSASRIHSLQPIMYVQEMIISVRDSFTRTLTTGWSYYRQTDNGRILVVQSQPRTFTDFLKPDGQDVKTSAYMETSLRSLDNSATPNLKPAQIHSVISDVSGDVSGDLNMAAHADTDMLDCVSRRTGLPRLVLSSTIFLSAIVMIYICLTTAATAPEHRIRSEKLSIYGDLHHDDDDDDDDRLILLDPQLSLDEKPLVHLHPRQAPLVDLSPRQAAPLPGKIHTI